MPVPEDIASLAERAARELGAMHDFFEHTKFVWKSFQANVQGGLELISTNPASSSNRSPS